MIFRILNVCVTVLLPVLASLKVLNSNDKILLKSWLKLLTVLLLVTNLETSQHFQCFYESYAPFKKYGVLMLNLWIVSPYSKGYIVFFNQFIQPVFSKYHDFPKVMFKKDNSTVYLNSEKLYGLNNLYLEKLLDKLLQIVHGFILCSLTTTFGFGKKELYFYQSFIKDRIPIVYVIFKNYYDSLVGINSDLRILRKRYKKKIMNAICHAVNSSPIILTKMEKEYIEQKRTNFLKYSGSENLGTNPKSLEHFSKFKEAFIQNNLIIPSPKRNLYVERFILQYKEYANSPSLFNISLSLILFIYNFLSNYALILFYKTFRIGINEKESSKLFSIESEEVSVNSPAQKGCSIGKIDSNLRLLANKNSSRAPTIKKTNSKSRSSQNSNVNDLLKKKVSFATQDTSATLSKPLSHPESAIEKCQEIETQNNLKSPNSQAPNTVAPTQDNEALTAKKLLPSYTVKTYPAQSIDSASGYDNTATPPVISSENKLAKSKVDQSGALQVSGSTSAKRRNSIKEFLKGGNRHGLSRFANGNNTSTKRNLSSFDQTDDSFANSTAVTNSQIEGNQSLNGNTHSSFYNNNNNSRVSTIDEKRENKNVLSNDLFLKSLNDLPSGFNQQPRKKSSSGRLSINKVYEDQNNAISVSSNLKANGLVNTKHDTWEKELVSPISLDSNDNSNKRNFTLDSSRMKDAQEKMMLMSDPFGAILSQNENAEKGSTEQESSPISQEKTSKFFNKNPDDSQKESIDENVSSGSRSPEKRQGFHFFKKNKSSRNNSDGFVSGEDSFSTLDFNQVGKQFDPRLSFEKTSRRSIDNVINSIRKSIDGTVNNKIDNTGNIESQETVNRAEQSKKSGKPEVTNTLSVEKLSIENSSPSVPGAGNSNPKKFDMNTYLQLTGDQTKIRNQPNSDMHSPVGTAKIPVFSITNMDVNDRSDQRNDLNNDYHIITDDTDDIDSVSSADSWNRKDEDAGLKLKMNTNDPTIEKDIYHNLETGNTMIDPSKQSKRHDPQRSHSSIGVEFIHSFTPNINKSHGFHSENNASFSDRDTIDYLSYQPTNSAKYNKFPLLEMNGLDDNVDKKKGKLKKGFFSDVLSKRKSKKSLSNSMHIPDMLAFPSGQTAQSDYSTNSQTDHHKKRSVSLVFRSKSKSHRDSIDKNAINSKSQSLFRNRNSSVVSYSEDPCTY